MIRIENVIAGKGKRKKDKKIKMSEK